jgi:hypothetical protein
MQGNIEKSLLINFLPYWLMLRKLPLSGVQDFAKIRTDYALYVDKTAYKPVEEALKQIEEKKYYVPYMEKGLNIFKIGVVFGENERNVAEWRVA